MGKITVKLDIGDGRLRSLASQLRRINRQLDRAYQQGQANNNVISNQTLTNLQNQLGVFNQATTQKKQQLSADLQQAQLTGNTRLINRIITEIDQLVEAQVTSNQFLNSDKYQAVNGYQVSSSKPFRSSRWNSRNLQFKTDLDSLRHDIGQFSNRVKILNNRWKTSMNTGVITHERYKSYQNTAQELRNEGRDQSVESFQGRLDSLTSQYEQEQQELSHRRAQLQVKIQTGNGTREDSLERAEIDEQLAHLRKYTAELRKLSVTLDRANKSIQDSSRSINGAQGNPEVKILSPTNSISGFMRNHTAVFARAVVVGGIASFGAAMHTGDRVVLNTFDNIKSVAYNRGGNDNSVMNQIENVGYPMGYDSETMGKYLNAYTSTTDNANLSNRQMNSLLSAWGGLSRYSGAKEVTTQQLESIVGITSNYKSASKNAGVAKAIQNELTNSGMSAKADEQQSALAGMLSIASQSAGGLSAQEQKNIAGFQGLMAKLGSDFQGQNGLKAYQGLVAAWNPMNIQARMIWGAQDPTNRSQLGQAYLTEEMQNAPAHPWEYKKPISNLLAHAATMSNTKSGQRHIAAADLMELSGNQLTPDQAEKLVKAYQENKLTKKKAEQIVKGSGKGQKAKYDMTTTKGRQQYYSAYKSMARKTSRDLNILRGHLARINKTYWVAPIIGSAISGMTTGLMFAGFRALMHNPRSAVRVAKSGSKVVRGVAGKIGRHIPKGASKVASGAKKAGTRAAGRTADSLDSRLRNTRRGTRATNTRAQGTLRQHGRTARGRRTTRGRNNKVTKRGSMLGLGLGLGLGSGLLGGGSSDENTAHASTRRPKGRQGKSNSRSVNIMLHKVIAKRKYLWSEEWSLIRHLNIFWDVWLRHVKENAGNGKGDKDSGDVSDDGSNKDREYWKKKIKEVAKAMHVSITDAQVDAILGVIQGESGFNEKAVGGNDGLSDGNAMGLLQFKQGTFDNYAAKGHHDIMSGVDQLYAFFNIANWANYATGHAGWSPSGPARGYENGGIREHALGGIFNQRVSNQRSQATPQMLNDLRTVNWMSRIRQPGNYIKVERKAPKFKVNIKVAPNAKVDKQGIINQVINNEFNGWLNRKQQQKLIQYYSNETSSLV